MAGASRYILFSRGPRCVHSTQWGERRAKRNVIERLCCESREF